MFLNLDKVQTLASDLGLTFTTPCSTSIALTPLFIGIERFRSWRRPPRRSHFTILSLKQFMYETSRHDLIERLCDRPCPTSSPLQALRRKGVKLGVVTNSSHSNEEKLGWFAKAGLPFEWDAFINSCEVRFNLFNFHTFLELPPPRIGRCGQTSSRYL